MKLNSFAVLVSSLACHGALGAPSMARRDDPPHNHAPAKPALEAKYFKDLGAKRVRITYGPFLVPPVSDEEWHGMKGWEVDVAEMPCKDCLITGYQGGLEFTDGSVANAHKGMWLHHAVFINRNRTDTTCSDYPDRVIGAGNERTPIDLTVGGVYKNGYYIKKDDMITLSVELMNEAYEAREAVITAEWEYIQGSPKDFDIIQPVWLDVTGLCSNSSLTVTVTDKPFQVSMNQTWSPPFTGNLVAAMPHMHDGGIKQELTIDGKVVCDNVANYGETAEYITHVGMFTPPATPGHEHAPEQEEHEHPHRRADDPPHEHEEEEKEGHDHNSGTHTLHISSLKSCTNVGKIGPETKFGLTSFYDMKGYTGMKGHHGDGSLEPVMGIQLLYVSRPREEAMKEIEAAVGPKNGPFERRPREEETAPVFLI